MNTATSQLNSYANFLYQKRLLMAANEDNEEILKKGIKALAKMSYEEFEGLKEIIKILSIRAADK